MDALTAAVGREVGAPVVSNDRDLTHEEAQKVVDVETYRDETDSPHNRGGSSRL
jgi:hypothetical protein